MELWHAWTCPYSMRVRAALAEAGVPYRPREVDPGAPGGEFLRVNPQGTLPVLVDGRAPVAGWLPVLEHVSRRWPEPPLFPEGVGRGAVVRLCERVDALFAPQLARIDRGTASLRVEGLSAARRAMGDLDGQVHEQGYLLGAFSAADLALASMVARLPGDWRPAPLGFDRLAAWERQVFQRPAVREQMGPRPTLVG